MPAAIFSGDSVQLLKDELLFPSNNVKMICRAVDPQSSAVTAALGSILVNPSTGRIYQKFDGGSSTNWGELGGRRAQGVSSDTTFGVLDGTIVWDISGASRVATLPTAVGCAGKRYTAIVGSHSGSFTLTVNTTSSQTIGGRASGSIILRRLGDHLTVESTGANWVIVSKQETEMVTVEPSQWPMSTIGNGASAYVAMTGASFIIRPGIWKTSVKFAFATGSGDRFTIYSGSGVYGGAGANNSTVPTTPTGIIAGQYTWATSGITHPVIVPAGAFYMGSSLLETYWATTTDKTLYIVPQVENVTAGNGVVSGHCIAQRIF